MPNRQPLRVLHIITRMIVGGAQENTLLSVEGLSRLGPYEVTLATGIETGPEGDLLARSRSTVPLIPVPDLRRAVHPILDVRALFHLYRIIRDGNYHIVHTHSAKAGVLGRLAAKLAGAPLIVHTLHGLQFHDYQPWWVNRLWRAIKTLCGRITDQYVSVSRVISDKAIAAGIAPAAKFRTIFSGMELDWFLQASGDPASVRQELGISPGTLVVGKVARLFPLKGHDSLVDAAPAIVDRYPNVRFLLVGDGILHDRLRARAKALGVLDHFIFAGLVERERIPGMLAAMDVVVHTSLREGLARVLVQALAMGKPCVSFDIDGAPEVVIPGKTGYLVKPLDLPALSDAICRLLADPEERARMGQAGRDLVDPAFRAETMVEGIAALYQELAARYPERMKRFEAASRTRTSLPVQEPHPEASLTKGSD